MSNYQDDLRNSLITDEFESDFGVREKQKSEITTGKIFGLAAGERMLLSIILFIATLILSAALLLATQTVVLPG